MMEAADDVEGDDIIDGRNPLDREIVEKCWAGTFTIINF